MKVGISASRQGLSPEQIKNLKLFVSKFGSHQDLEIHHGDCVGGDDQVVNILRRYFPEATIVCHPPEDDKLRAYIESDKHHEEKPYLSRNKDIVKFSEIMVFFPSSNEEIVRSGTWSTFRFTKEHQTEYVLFLPNGTIETS